MPSQSVEQRTRNRRGEGSRLRTEIVQVAADMLDEGVNEDSISLRAVARRVGIAAQSIYAHFPDRDAILLEVVKNAFAELGTHLSRATLAAEGSTVEVSAVDSLSALCDAYLSFALERPRRYRILFGGVWDASRAKSSPSVGDEVQTLGQDVFGIFVSALDRCVTEGSSTSTDTYADAAALWAGMHGYASVRPATPEFRWPDDVPRRIVNGLAKLCGSRP
ncbi:TetR/AcrR family transcriptional regulator [Cryobacterium sp. TMT1-3]|uniref:TetR/AcrR family transcriptional regulator n=1 Tax=Cryobacterium luteum TaxID=1424661 RepID=A0A1H8F3Q3_9MICO|nr:MULTISPECIES: TetR/AcrR family transcriptional regulator [Cryobacterium]TFB85506.1 TetR/AcrR family transcriptional regulator [Cryobacterium luteum]TFC26589.1 TetR/AcrR family transcriptional regulator [Cryobacterium sp. TMT1-3]SEN26531.1 transcriptional regulator, TetR family [Cryobacterium luteum]